MPTNRRAQNVTIVDRSQQPSTDVAPEASFTFRRSQTPIEVEYIQQVVLAHNAADIAAHTTPPAITLPLEMLGSSRAGRAEVVDLRSNTRETRYAFISEVIPDAASQSDIATEIVFADAVADFSVLDLFRMVAILAASVGRRLLGLKPSL